VHISERGRCVLQWRILASLFSLSGHERSPKSAPQHAPTDINTFYTEDMANSKKPTTQ